MCVCVCVLVGRVVNARFGVVLSSKGGALAKLLPIFLLGGGGVLVCVCVCVCVVCVCFVCVCVSFHSHLLNAHFC